ncbi:DMT family transporter [Phaeovulum vinaykumarii]|uniref:Permease of the drug/metabolite transporter (DMT) superfamily n=1 Tax=Phaeovulum vinaykumarii TaxID=407234 RepID=A0A1N7MNG8_9RHOB|nr:DMT family transporter [Phaeovulum vinaykumarii]SIS87548.1 Permease of the drug/metabolite transporter (DMT) superfamily [Phaeovulum vinaykumarii]SOC13088.1 drug/metabolite transporter (DMT)-like permease [Phaeovulum vinaykumarii]
MSTPQSPSRAILFKLVSVSAFAAMAALIKAASGRVPPGEAVFFRSAFAIPVILIWLAASRGLATGLKVSNPLGHFWRGFVGTAAMGLGFAGLGLLPLPEVTAIGYAAPLLTVIFAAMFLGEEVRLFRMSAVALGLAGVLIVLSPRLGATDGNETEALGAMVTLMGAVCAALAQVFVRKLVRSETTSAIVFWFSVTSAGLALLTAPFGWVWPDPAEATLLICAGLFGGVGQICLTSAYRHADAGVVAPFDYVSMLFALAIGYLVFAETPSAVMLAGAGLIVGAGVIIIWRERQLGLARARARKAMTPQG